MTVWNVVTAAFGPSRLRIIETARSPERKRPTKEPRQTSVVFDPAETHVVLTAFGLETASHADLLDLADPVIGAELTA